MTGYSVYENVLCECFLRQRLSLQMCLLSQKDGAKVVIFFFSHKFLEKKMREMFIPAFFIGFC